MSRILRDTYGSEKFLKIFQCFIQEVKILTQYRPDDQNEMIMDFIGLARIACSETWSCPNCLKKYEFRHCYGDLDKTIHAIEINCDLCGDNFTFTENDDTISYFNSHVFNKVNNLRSWGKGLDIKLFSNLASAAMLTVDSSSGRPVLWLDRQRVKSVKEVDRYWKWAKNEWKRRCEQS
ncbi:hypothetical protein DFP95_10839 [Cohnella lupini]|uniref:Uncharacterized protein n=2 Tax=Cohnella lupini TaxID=1294267 RepID=A0A3D9IA53_9BACL|nr:hypothetical protein DFP95_10839 [Cohnella lupini]